MVRLTPAHFNQHNYTTTFIPVTETILMMSWNHIVLPDCYHEDNLTRTFEFRSYHNYFIRSKFRKILDSYFSLSDCNSSQLSYKWSEAKRWYSAEKLFKTKYIMKMASLSKIQSPSSFWVYLLYNEHYSNWFLKYTLPNSTEYFY